MNVELHKKRLRDVFLGAAVRPEDMIRSCKAVLGSLPIIANTLVQQQGKSVTIEYGHQLGATDGKTIKLMDMPIPQETTDVDTFVLMLSLAYGLLHHELGHINETDFGVLPEAAQDPLVLKIFGIIEDIREENAHLRRYPAARPYLDCLNDAMFVTGHYRELSPADAPMVALTGYLAHRLWSDYRGAASVAGYASQAEDVVRHHFPGSLLVRIEAVLPRIKMLEDTAEALALSRDIKAIVADELEKAKQEKAERNQEKADSDDSQPAPTDADTGPGGGGTQPDDDDQSDDDTTSNPDVSSDDDARDDDDHANTGDASDKGSQDHADGSDADGATGGEGSPSDLDRMIASLQAALDGDDSDQAYGDRGDAANEALAAIVTQVQQEGADDTVSMTGVFLSEPVEVEGASIPLTDTPYDMGQALAVTGQLRQKLVREMQALTDRDVSVHTRGRKISGRHLARIGVGDGRIFKKMSQVVETDTAVQLLLDASVSMRRASRMDMACQALFASATALDAIDGVQCAAATFPFYQVLKPFGKATRLCSHNFHVAPKGSSTPMAEGIVLGQRMLATTTAARKVMIVITDGEPDSRPQTELAIITAQHAGIEVFGLGIDTDAGRGLFPNWLSIRTVSDLPYTMIDLLRSRLLNAA